MATTTDSLWYMYGQQILQQAAPAFDPTEQTFSLASATLTVDLGNPNPQIVNNYVYNIGNAIPAPGPAYAPASSLLTSYQLFLDAINLGGSPNPNLDSQISIAAGNMTAAQTNFGNVQLAAVTAWKAFQSTGSTIGFSDYTTKYYPTYAAARNQLAGATSQWQSLMTTKYGQGFEVLDNARLAAGSLGGAGDVSATNSYNMPIEAGAVAAPGSQPTLAGQTPPPPASSLVSSFAPLFTLDGFTPKFAEWQANSATGAAPAASIHISGDASSANWSNMGWSSESAGMLDLDFFEAFGQTSSSGTGNSNVSFSTGFDMQIDFVGLSSFIIQPGEWFEPGLIQAYKTKLLPNSPAFFTPTGALGRVPNQAVIGFNPTIKLMLANSDYAAFRSTFESESTAAVAFGPFVVGETHSSTYSDKSSVSFDDSSASVTIAPPASAIPVLLGVISTRMDV